MIFCTTLPSSKNCTETSFTPARGVHQAPVCRSSLYSPITTPSATNVGSLTPVALGGKRRYGPFLALSLFSHHISVPSGGGLPRLWVPAGQENDGGVLTASHSSARFLPTIGLSPEAPPAAPQAAANSAHTRIARMASW